MWPMLTSPITNPGGEPRLPGQLRDLAGTVALNWLAPGSVESSSMPIWLLPPVGSQRERQADRLGLVKLDLGARDVNADGPSPDASWAGKVP